MDADPALGNVDEDGDDEDGSDGGDERQRRDLMAASVDGGWGRREGGDGGDLW